MKIISGGLTALSNLAFKSGGIPFKSVTMKSGKPTFSTSSKSSGAWSGKLPGSIYSK
jgi:hypothetical protein